MSSGNPGEATAASEISKNSSRRKRQPSLLESLLVDPQQDASEVGFGILCNDPTGLCLSANGSFVPKKKDGKTTLANMDDSVNSGVYTSLTKLAQQLSPGPTDSSAAPLITVETDDCNLLIKEYDGHAIALKVPAASAAPSGLGGVSGGSSHTNGIAGSN